MRRRFVLDGRTGGGVVDGLFDSKDIDPRVLFGGLDGCDGLEDDEDVEEERLSSGWPLELCLECDCEPCVLPLIAPWWDEDELDDPTAGLEEDDGAVLMLVVPVPFVECV